ncbi:efflux RND transporter periplasmic adaptor subunit [Dasania sp. GY-MA-18]|uniref:Efflux RND transporter periplasmic adaptor subunit n=1 Tax=Dasania phycosphaerae TaxID=2950436 RepID=A0A9J6RSE8_9GAMM|nr:MULTISPECIES: efflux RND transporter periplasmic adaptor subunit [Dasania]MCR8924421.1 efflux RND transporter periplasmic adaptor subunit [Dasania sp. GY-MA-18]MCZ0867096.1 efflux RND transporter periplasmic adaptor subunit [Dasania phycosphaerae]MCZ0870548.1 efflux RND transporter periplasmic adaptor subunit [Dasania phycosphaerae]
MLKRMTLMLLSVTLIFGGIFAYKWLQGVMMGEYFASFRPPPVTVSAASAQQQSWHPYLTAIGTLRARYGVNISAEVEGMVKAIRFDSGQDVNKGQLLLELDDEVEQANLRIFAAQLKLTKLNYERDKALIKKQLVSQNQFDRSFAEYKETLAKVEQTKASIAKKKILAPFSGRMGILQVDLGQYIDSGTSIGSLQSAKTMYLDFSLPEKNLTHLFVGQTVKFTVAAYPGEIFEAQLAAIDSKVDISTRSLQVRAHVDNSQQRLVPGMFADVTLILEPAQELVVLPATAVNYSLYGKEVFIISEQQEDGSSRLVVNRQRVTTGQQQGDLIAITEGVQPGQQVVIDGQLKLNNGTEIAIAPAVSKE